MNELDTGEKIGQRLMQIEALLGEIAGFFKLHHWALIALACVLSWTAGRLHMPF